MSSTEKAKDKPKKVTRAGEWPVIWERPRAGEKVVYLVDTCRKLPKRERLTFPTFAEAKVQCEKYRATLKNQGKEAFNLSPAQREDAVKAMQLCRELGIGSLTEALGRLKPFVSPPSGTIGLNDLVVTYLEFYFGKVQAGQRSQRQYQTIKDRASFLVKGLGADVLVNSISGKVIWDFLSNQTKVRDWKRNTLKRYCDVARQLFQFAVEKGFTASNPMDCQTIRFDKKEALEASIQEPPEILTINQAQRLLEISAHENEERGMLAFVAICLFTGARPDAEALKMTWEDIDLAGDGGGGKVWVRPNKTKNTSSSRSVPIGTALDSWLRLCDNGKPLIPQRGFTYRWKKLRREVGLPNVTDLTRHSFCSYSYALHGDKTKLENEMGHVNQAMLRHYLSVKPAVRRDAKLYFGLTRTKVLGVEDNVIWMGEAG